MDTSETSSKSQGDISDDQNDTDAAKRKLIQTAMKDSSLSDHDRRLKILSIMNGSSSAQSVDITSALHNSDATVVIGCVHYDRQCYIVAPCCEKLFGCRLCHDENTHLQHGPMNRFEVQSIMCKLCNTRQMPSNNCQKCGVQFGEYYCEICRLWMKLEKEPFHCNECGICRVGGRDNFQHCVQCCMCLSLSVIDNHICLKEKYKDFCPVCREDIFASRCAPQELPCGHVIHAQCFRKLAHHDFRCPICKKTVVEKRMIKAEWDSRARDIRSQPMPSDLARTVDILCYDCQGKSYSLAWHFLGIQCPSCESFNTVLMNKESHRGET